ncbi:hypothetical protein CHS0354_008030 [Potamilus streckersoni]|uniref:Uncharacterized protein n=1 Tax=Potamilus streckersoni TaxID=2493646 RepID=A0AAE0VDS4_9BIVA|nr:hypothetical protein CHS0354_008030 [Potamilus streckersoni]
MDGIQDRLLEHVIPQQEGHVGNVCYKFSEMRIVQVHWPRVSNISGKFLASDGALRIEGQYQLHKPGRLGYTKNGNFSFDIDGIHLTIMTNQHTREGASNGPVHVTCSVGRIKIKFHGGAAFLCQLLTSLYIRMYHHHLERQMAEVFQETISREQHLVVSALTVMAAINSSQNGEQSENPNTESNRQEQEQSADCPPPRNRFQRFLSRIRSQISL